MHHHTGRSRAAGYACIAAATLFWGISATLGRAVFTGRLHLWGHTVEPIQPLMLAQSRTTFAFLVLAPLLALLRGPRSLRLQPRDAVDAMLVGSFGIAASNFFYYYAIQQTTVATAIILQYSAPVMVLLYMVARGLQRATPPRLLGVTLAVIGSVLAIGVVERAAGSTLLFRLGSGAVKFNAAGVVAALVAAVAFSFYNVFGQHLVARHDRWRVLVWAMAGAALGWILVNPPWKIVAAHYSTAQWTFMAVFSAFSVMVPFSLYFWGLEFLDPTRAIVTSCLEPVFAIAIAAAALGERVNHIQIAGIVITLSATVLVQLPEAAESAPVVVEPIE